MPYISSSNCVLAIAIRCIILFVQVFSASVLTWLHQRVDRKFSKLDKSWPFLHRGIRTRNSFGFLEVVVRCETVDTNSSPDNFGTCNDRRKLIYLHLKKFFRGTRYTSQPFLKKLEERYKIGDTVCVSGKVSIQSLDLQDCVN